MTKIMVNTHLNILTYLLKYNFFLSWDWDSNYEDGLHDIFIYMQIKHWEGFYNGLIKSSGIGDENTCLKGVNHRWEAWYGYDICFK